MPKRINLFLLFVVCILYHSDLSANYIFPVFPAGDTNVSTAARILFQAQYPINMEALQPTSPLVFDESGNSLPPQYLVIPTEYVNEPLKERYAVECQLYVSDSNLITILPYKPFNYNTSYSVIFNNFPLLIPNINNSNGYNDYSASLTFGGYFTTEPGPLSFELSFEATHGLVWCNRDVSIKFNKPITPTAQILQEMFSIVETETNTTIPADVLLSEDGMTVNLFPNEQLDGGGYFLQMNMSSYTGDERLDNSYRFVVEDEVVIKFKSNIDSNYRNSQYGHYSTFHYGDTLHFNTKNFVQGEDYVFESWELSGIKDTNYIVDSSGILKIIFDCDNYFFNNNSLEQQITLTANYIQNPIDTLVLAFNPSNLSQLCDTNYHLGYEFTNSLTKSVQDTIFTVIEMGKDGQPPIYNTKLFHNKLLFTYFKYSDAFV